MLHPLYRRRATFGIAEWPRSDGRFRSDALGVHERRDFLANKTLKALWLKLITKLMMMLHGVDAAVIHPSSRIFQVTHREDITKPGIEKCMVKQLRNAGMMQSKSGDGAVDDCCSW